MASGNRRAHKGSFPARPPKAKQQMAAAFETVGGDAKTIGQGAPHLQQPTTPQSGSLLPTTNPALRRARHQPRNPPSHIQQQSLNYDIKASLRGTRPQGRGPPAAHRGVHAKSMHILPQPGSTNIRDPMAFPARMPINSHSKTKQSGKALLVTTRQHSQAPPYHMDQKTDQNNKSNNTKNVATQAGLQ